MKISKKWITVIVCIVAILVLAVAIYFGYQMIAINGTYYEDDYGELDKDSYFVLKFGKWENEGGEKGTYKLKNGKITFYMEVLGEKVDMVEGTLKDGVLKYSTMGKEHSYYRESSVHDIEITFDANGGSYQDGSTTYKVAAKSNMPIYNVSQPYNSQSEYVFDGWSKTKDGSQPYDLTKNSSKKSITLYAIWSLPYALSKTSSGYKITGVKDLDITTFNIPQGITEIGTAAFSGCKQLTSIEIPDSVTSIGRDVFEYCSSLKEIHFHGTKAQWNTIEKSYYWNFNTGNYTIYCTDGEIAK